MPMEVTLPELGEGIDAADVLTVRVSTGERVEKGQALLEIENEKATAEVPAPVSGTVVEVRISEGDRVAPGQVIVILDPEAGATDETPETTPSESDGDAETESSDAAARPASDVPEVEAETAPEPAVEPPPQPSVAEPASGAPSDGQQHLPVPASPKIRRLARELGLDLTDVTGSGPHGRIVEEDVQSAVRARLSASAAGSAAELPDLSRWGEVTREPMDAVRRATVQSMSRAWATVPHVTHFDRADITELEDQRRSLAQEIEGGRLTLTAVLVRLVAEALARFPKFTAAVDSSRNEIAYREGEDVAVAVDTPRGLLVPVIRDARDKSLSEISTELEELAEKARERRLQAAEMEGAVFTISNLGGIGGTGFTPVVPWPQVAILGVARASTEPVWNGEEFVPRLVLPLALSYDHRLIDGADAARFLRWLCRALERPLAALL